MKDSMKFAGLVSALLFAISLVANAADTSTTTVVNTSSGTATGYNTSTKDTTTIGTDKNTGGEAPGDREKMEDIKEKLEKLREKPQKPK